MSNGFGPPPPPGGLPVLLPTHSSIDELAAVALRPLRREAVGLVNGELELLRELAAPVVFAVDVYVERPRPLEEVRASDSAAVVGAAIPLQLVVFLRPTGLAHSATPRGPDASRRSDPCGRHDSRNPTKGAELRDTRSAGGNHRFAVAGEVRPRLNFFRFRVPGVMRDRRGRVRRHGGPVLNIFRGCCP